MKTFSFRSLLTGILFSASVTISGTTACAQFASPAGTWDVVTSGGGQSGLMILRFDDTNPDFTAGNQIEGYAILAPTSKIPSTSTSDRGGTGGRGNEGGNTNSVSSKTNIFGFVPIFGEWRHDPKGYVIGFYHYIVQMEGSTDLMTNSVSFKGKAVANKRLTLVGSTSFGKVNFRGIPLTTVTTATGGSFDGSRWYGNKKTGGVKYLEFFEIAQDSVPNLYIMDGQGPSYSYPYTEYSWCIISKQKKIAFSVREMVGTNSTLRASMGVLKNGKTVSSKTKGLMQPNSNFTFDVFKY